MEKMKEFVAAHKKAIVIGTVVVGAVVTGVIVYKLKIKPNFEAALEAGETAEILAETATVIF